MFQLLGTILWLLAPIDFRAYKEKFQPFATVNLLNIRDHYDNLLQEMQTLHCHSNTLLLMNVYNESKCSSLL